MQINHINKTLVEIAGFEVIPLLNGRVKWYDYPFVEGKQLVDIGEALCLRTQPAHAPDIFTPGTNRDHAFMVWDSLDGYAKREVERRLLIQPIPKRLEDAKHNSGLLYLYDATPLQLCRAILDVMRPGWEVKQ